ncbi:11907_t:CDS:2 [Funneliformis geosporum]|nr:11907_t:CDS:2 [Funneliformis geosporum]
MTKEGKRLRKEYEKYTIVQLGEEEKTGDYILDAEAIDINFMIKAKKVSKELETQLPSFDEESRNYIKEIITNRDNDKGIISNWDTENRRWARYPYEVVLKSLRGSQNIKGDFLREIAAHKIVRGLYSIHEEDLVHHDFHPGNILIGESYGIEDIYITDLGLCRPADETNSKKIFGVLPYIAPEVLRGQPYTQASDIYSFGMIAYEIMTGLPPCFYKKGNGNKYYERTYDVGLFLDILNKDLRPKFNIKMPSFPEELIKQC